MGRAVREGRAGPARPKVYFFPFLSLVVGDREMGHSFPLLFPLYFVFLLFRRPLGGRRMGGPC